MEAHHGNDDVEAPAGEFELRSVHSVKGRVETEPRQTSFAGSLRIAPICSPRSTPVTEIVGEHSSKATRRLASPQPMSRPQSCELVAKPRREATNLWMRRSQSPPPGDSWYRILSIRKAAQPAANAGISSRSVPRHQKLPMMPATASARVMPTAKRIRDRGIQLEVLAFMFPNSVRLFGGSTGDQ